MYLKGLRMTKYFMYMTRFFNQILYKYRFGFRQGYNTQNFLLVVVQKWKEALDKSWLGRALLTYLSKAFDCIRPGMDLVSIH